MSINHDARTVLMRLLIPRPLGVDMGVRLRARVGSAHYIECVQCEIMEQCEMELAETLPSASCSSTEAEFATHSAASDGDDSEDLESEENHDISSCFHFDSTSMSACFSVT